MAQSLEDIKTPISKEWCWITAVCCSPFTIYLRESTVLMVVIPVVLQFVSLMKMHVGTYCPNSERGRIKSLEGNTISEHTFLHSKPKN